MFYLRQTIFYGTWPCRFGWHLKVWGINHPSQWWCHFCDVRHD